MVLQVMGPGRRTGSRAGRLLLREKYLPSSIIFASTERYRFGRKHDSLCAERLTKHARRT